MAADVARPGNARCARTGRGLGAILIAADDRLCRTVSRVVEVAVPRRRAADTGQAVVVTADADHPLRSALLLAASVSHRGPPVSLRSLTVHSPIEKATTRMHFPSRAPKRALFTVAGTGVALSIGLASGAGPASAHVHVDADNPHRASTVGGDVPGARRVRKWLSDNTS